MAMSSSFSHSQALKLQRERSWVSMWVWELPAFKGRFGSLGEAWTMLLQRLDREVLDEELDKLPGY